MGGKILLWPNFLNPEPIAGQGVALQRPSHTQVWNSKKSRRHKAEPWGLAPSQPSLNLHAREEGWELNPYWQATQWSSYSCACQLKVRKVLLSHVWLFATSWTVARQAPLSMGIPRQEYWSGLLCLFPGDLPNPGIKPKSPTLQADSLLSVPPRKPKQKR